MTTSELSQFMLESSKNDTLKQYADRLVLRIFEYPSLMSFLNKINILDDEVELEFILIPDDAIENVKNIIGKAGTEIQVLSYTQDDRRLTGIKIKPGRLQKDDGEEPKDQKDDKGATGGLIKALLKAQESTDAGRILNELFDRKAVEAETQVSDTDHKHYVTFPVSDEKGNKEFFILMCDRGSMPEDLDAFEDLAPTTWNVRFRPEKEPAHSPYEAGNSYGITGSGLNFQVLPVVTNLLSEWISSAKPEFITFSAKEPSRIRLYNAMVKRFTETLGYKLITSNKGSATTYLIGRADVA